ncbi:MAG: beta-ketoacyl-ACP synthase III [bacterium]
MNNVGIIGIGHYVPEKILTNNDLEKIVNTTNEWIMTRTGISERRIAEENIPTSYLATKAANEAIQNANIKSEEIDLIIVATITPDMTFPSTACIVQAQIGAFNAACFDLQAACSGFVFALHTAEQFIANGVYKNILVIAADKMSSIVDWQDRNTCVLFGDGACACILSQSSSKKILKSYWKSDGRFKDIVYLPGGGSQIPPSHKMIEEKLQFIKMDGKILFKHAVTKIEESIKKVISLCNLSIDDISLIIPHQANIRIIEAIYERLKVPKEKVFINLHKYGNLSAASVGVCLSEISKQNTLKSGDKILLTTVGAGLSWASMIIEW